MSIDEREYMRQRAAPGVTPVVKWLLIVNVLVWLADLMLAKKYGTLYALSDGTFYNNPPIREWGEFAVETAVKGGAVWQFLTFQFLHGHIGHLLMNSLGLFFFGPWMERWWGSAKFLVFYLLCGAGGGLLYTTLVLTGALPSGSLVGASAGIYGILIGVAVIAPDLRARLLFPPVELSMRMLALLILGIAAGSIVFRLGGNEGGEAGHLGGAIMGFLMVKFPILLGKGGKIIAFPKKRRDYEAKMHPRHFVNHDTDDAVDAILDKINREGIQSLTAEDKAVLENARKP